MTELDLRSQAEELAAVAGRAPSLHNAQPWAFRFGRDTVEVYFDDQRMVPLADPVGRQAYLGLGAATFLLRLALAVRRHDVRVELRPDVARPDLLALLTIVGRREPTPEEDRLAAAVTLRRTVRTPFVAGDVPVDLRVAWREHVEAERGDLRWVDRIGERSGLATLVGMAERQQQGSKAFVAELQHWTEPDLAAERAGVPPSAFGVTAEAGHAAEFALRDFGGGRRSGPERADGPVEEHPVVAVLHTPADDPEDWIRGGQALMRMLLAAATDGFVASYLNQPLEIPALRQQVRDELRLDGWPQLVLRLGRPSGPLPPPTPRRNPADLLRP
jgi:hypothetical protein